MEPQLNKRRTKMKTKITNRIKLWIVKVFKIDTYAKDFMALSQKFQKLKENYEIRNDVLATYEREINGIECKLKELESLCEDPTRKINELLEEIERTKHSAYAAGRRDAYAEMGIKALDKRLMNEALYLDHTDNEITEEEYKELEEFCKMCEIDIDDLEDVK